MKKIIIILVALFTLYSYAYSVQPLLPHSDNASGTYSFRVVCIPYVGPMNQTTYLGEFFSGGAYTTFLADEQNFVIEGQMGMVFNVSTTTVTNDHGVQIEYIWSINQNNSFMPTQPNTDLSNVPVAVWDGTGCSVKAYLKCKVTNLLVPATGIMPGMKTFNVILNATLASY